MIKKTKLAKSLLALVLSGTMIMSNLTPAMASEVTGSEVQVESDSNSADEEQGSLSETEEKSNEISENIDAEQSDLVQSKVIESETEEKPDAPTDDLPEKSDDLSVENQDQKKTEEKVTGDSSDASNKDEVEIFAASNTEYAVAATLKSARKNDTFYKYDGGIDDILYSKNLTFTLEYADGYKECDTCEYGQYIYGKNDECYVLNLQSSDGTIYDPSNTPAGNYTVVLGYYTDENWSDFVTLCECAEYQIKIVDKYDLKLEKARLYSDRSKDYMLNYQSLNYFLGNSNHIHCVLQYDDGSIVNETVTVSAIDEKYTVALMQSNGKVILEKDSQNIYPAGTYTVVLVDENNSIIAECSNYVIEVLDYAQKADINISSEWSQLNIVKTKEYSYEVLEAFELNVSLQYANNIIKKCTVKNEFYDIDDDVYYYFLLKSSSGDLYSMSSAPNGSYTLVLGYEDKNQYKVIGENSTFPIEVYDLSAVSKNKITEGKQTVSAYGANGAKVIYAFTPTETGRYYIEGNCGYSCLQELDIDDEYEDFYGRSFLLEEGHTYDFLFYIKDHPQDEKNKWCEIYLNKSKKATQIQIEKGKTEYHRLSEIPYLKDWKIKFTYEDGQIKEYSFEQLWKTRWWGEDDPISIPRLELIDAYGNYVIGDFVGKFPEDYYEEDCFFGQKDIGQYEIDFLDKDGKSLGNYNVSIVDDKSEQWLERNLGLGTNKVTVYPYTAYYRWKIENAGVYKIEGTYQLLYGGQKWTRMYAGEGYEVIKARAGATLYIEDQTSGNINGEICEKEYVITNISDEECQHVYLKNETPATCETAGTIDYTCKLCGDHYTETIPATGHRHTTVKNASNPTCTTKGYSGDTYCTDCGKKLSSGKWTNAYGHALGANEVTKKATAVSAGWQTRTCSRCGYFVGSAIAKLPATGALSAGNFPLKVKQSYTLRVDGMAAGDYVVSWTSSNVKTATVNASGKVTGKKKGTATITAKLASGKVLSTKVKVQKGKVNTTKVTVNTKNITLKRGVKFQISAVRFPVTTQQGLTYSSSSKKIATVDKKGRITAKKKGKAKITVKSGKKSVKISVNVIE